MSRTTPTRVPDQVSQTDVEALHRLLDDSVLGNFAFTRDGTTMVLPIAIARDGDSVLLHGSTGSHWLRTLATGIPVTLAVTALEGLVVARSAFESSMRYRSAVAFGSCEALSGDAKIAALDVVTDHLIPGRVAELRRHSAKELAATLMLRMTIEEFSVKVGSDWPEDGPEDVAGDAWAGVLPTASGYTAALPTHDLRDGIPVPESVRNLLPRE